LAVTDSDALLVGRVVADDDRSAFELLVRRHQSPLRSFLRRLARNDVARADDLAQETFIKAYRGLPTYKGTAKFSSWLYRIAYTTFLNDQRKRYATTELDEMEHGAGADDAEHASNEWDIDRALQRLSIRQRAVFELHYKKGMTHQEVASALDLPLGTVKSDLTRGHERLKAYFEVGRQ
jgi:RNA polymerase sigma-70 factor (ECF subfamily)